MRRGIGSDPRIGYDFIYPGIGYGGSCFPKDMKALVGMAESAGVHPRVLGAVEARNAEQKVLFVKRIGDYFGGQLEGKTFALWGLSFKPNTDDIRLIQNKTKRGGQGGKRVMIPVGAPLKRMLDTLRAERSPNPLDRILLSSRGTPWTLNGFGHMFRETCATAGIEGLTFHDTRGTAVTRLALAGASVPQIATFTGHSLKDVEAILEVHYLNRDPRLAEDALEMLEMRLGTTVDAAVGRPKTGT